MLEVFQLKEKALCGKFLSTIIGGGADICSSTNTARQCEFGLEIIDRDAMNPLDSQPMLSSFIENADGAVKKKVFRGAQKLNVA